MQERRPISEKAQSHIDQTLYDRSLLTLTDTDMRFKSESETYSLPEIQQARLVTKNNNGLAFLSDIYQEMYPDATFFALTREPASLYESHKRRKLADSPEQFAQYYNQLGDRMMCDASRMAVLASS